MFFFFLHWIQAIGQMKTNKQAQTSDVLTKESWFCVCVSFCKTMTRKINFALKILSNQ